jgi:hypothetical protein
MKDTKHIPLAVRCIADDARVFAGLSSVAADSAASSQAEHRRIAARLMADTIANHAIKHGWVTEGRGPSGTLEFFAEAVCLPRGELLALLNRAFESGLKGATWGSGRG